MTVQYTNRKSKTYYLHEGKTKTGKAKYHFSMKKEGKLIKKIPDGYEIYEHPTNAQVFLRKEQPILIGYNLIISDPEDVQKLFYSKMEKII